MSIGDQVARDIEAQEDRKLFKEMRNSELVGKIVDRARQLTPPYLKNKIPVQGPELIVLKAVVRAVLEVMLEECREIKDGNSETKDT